MEISTRSDGLAESGMFSIVRNNGGTEDRLRNASETFIEMVSFFLELG